MNFALEGALTASLAVESTTTVPPWPSLEATNVEAV
jgi:hypothetical protein